MVVHGGGMASNATVAIEYLLVVHGGIPIIGTTVNRRALVLTTINIFSYIFFKILNYNLF
jgi:hypothetical protein